MIQQGHFWLCLTAALELGATPSPALGRGRTSVPRQGHNTPLPLRRSTPASFKRLLGGRPTRSAPAIPTARSEERRVGKESSKCRVYRHGARGEGTRKARERSRM